MTYQKPSTFVWLTVGGELVTDEFSWSEIAGEDISNAIPCYELKLSGAVRSSDLKFMPLEFVKPAGRSSPLIASAFIRRSTVEAEFHFFGADPNENVDSHRFTLQIGGGKVTNFTQELRTEWWAVADSRPVLTDTVQVSFSTCTWEHPLSGLQSKYNWESKA